ncbi:hypothetical protein C8Q70DRAFT_542399 [Cubamyces menziesii]|nr:hypothetical protein C8Q70DRAFT_542399 [Cubamyces menziesii]
MSSLHHHHYHHTYNPVDMFTVKRLSESDGGAPTSAQGSILDTLPPEIQHLIFRCASDDKPTILACSLVSSSWRDMSLPHLFSSLKVKRSSSHDDFNDFLAVHPHLARYVHELELGYLPMHFPGLPHTTIRPTLTPVKLSAITTKLPRLQALVLRSIWLADGANAEGDSTAHPFVIPRKLKRLTINECSVRRDRPLPLRVLFSILTAYPAREILLLFLSLDCEVPFLPNIQRASVAAQSANTLEVESLVVKRVFSEDWRNLEARLYDGFRQVLAPGCLRSLRAHATIHGRAPDAFHTLGSFIDHAGREALHHLELPFGIGLEVGLPESRPEYWRVLHLDRCRNLKSLRVTVTLPTSAFRSALQPPEMPLTTACIALIANLPSTLRTLELALWYVDAARVNDRKWLDLGELDEALLTHFSSLEKVKVVLCACGGWVECTQLALETMVKCRQRGILDVGPLDAIDYL